MKRRTVGDRCAGECRIGQKRDGAQIGLRATGRDVCYKDRRAADGVARQTRDRAADHGVAADSQRMTAAIERRTVGDRCAAERRIGQERDGIGIGLRAAGRDHSGERRRAAIAGGKVPDPGERSVDRRRAAEVEHQIVAAADHASRKRRVGAGECRVDQKRDGVREGLRAGGRDRSRERRRAAIAGGKIPDPSERSVDRRRAAEVEHQIVAAADHASRNRRTGAGERCVGQKRDGV